MLPIRKKRVLWGAAALALLALFAVCFIGFDAGALKEKIVAAAWDKTTRKLEINGALRLKILPRLAVEINDIHLSGPNGEGEFLQIGQLRGALEILPLLKGRFAVNGVQVRDFALFARRNHDGSTNFDDLFAKEEEAEQKPLDLAIGKLELSGGRLSWHEVASGQRFLLDDVYLNSGVMGMKAEGRLEVGGKLASSPLEGMVFALDSSYLIDGAALRLDAPRLILKGDEKEQIRLDWGARQVIADWGAPALAITGMKLEGHHISQLAAVLELDELNWRQENGLARGGSLRVTYMSDESAKGAPNFSLDAKLGALAGEGGSWQGEALEAVFAGKWQDSDLTGRINLPFVLQMREEGGIRLGVDALTLEAKAAGGRLKEALNARLDGSIEALLPEGTLSGKWQITQADSRLDFDWQASLPSRFVFKASLNKLDVDRYWSMEEQGVKEEGADNTEADEASSSSPAFPLELDGVLRIGELRMNGILVENLESRVVWAGGETAVTAPLEEGAGEKDGSGQKDVITPSQKGS